MIKGIKSLYIHFRLFLVAGVVILLFVLSFPLPFILPVAKTILIVFVAIIITDVILLYNPHNTFDCQRGTPNILSLNNVNSLYIHVINNSKQSFDVVLIDEFPYQLQKRDNFHKFRLEAGGEQNIHEEIKPNSRGEYKFGKVHLFISTTTLALIQRKISFDVATNLPVYPSVMDLKKYELRASSKLANYFGIKKNRRIGQSYEFEQISEYSQGDNYQHMNWKATSRVSQLMVNRYTEEKAQPIYCFIDKSRYMKMPFGGLSLLDYAINASLLISNTALNKDDKAGLLTFSDKVETLIKADNKRTQIQSILQTLYKEEETKIEANYELMYSFMRKRISGRSLIFLFANFDTVFALERVLPILRSLNQMHMLVVIVFENTELEDFHSTDAKDVLDIYNQTIARKVIYEKRQVLSLLKQHAIRVIYTKPEELSLNTLNKYLELKARGLL